MVGNLSDETHISHGNFFLGVGWCCLVSIVGRCDDGHQSNENEELSINILV